MIRKTRPLAAAGAPSLVIGLLGMGILGAVSDRVLGGLDPPSPVARIQVVGEPEVVYRWRARDCKEDTWPDAPARAFRGTGGKVRLIAAGYDNWSMTGPDLNSVRTDCHPLIMGGKEDDPGQFDDLPWIEATYAQDAKHIFALMSNEWSAIRHRDTSLARESECTDPHQQNCYFYSITESISVDGGLNFSYPSGRRVVAVQPERFKRQQGSKSSQGYATVSNLFARGGYFYAFIGARASGMQPGGNCLIRTRDLSDPTSWRGWNGSDFKVEFVDPYREIIAQPSRHICQVIAVPGDRSAEVRSVNWHPGLHCYIAVVRGVLTPVGADQPLAGFFFSTSPDLLHWSRAGLIMPLELSTSCKPLLFYPSLLDPTSSGQNFEEVGDSPYLYYSRFNIVPSRCQGTVDRDLVRSRLLINPADR